MNPSRELDALIAKELMGWSDVKYEGKYYIPDYSNQLLSAWEVVETISQLGFSVRIQLDVDEPPICRISPWSGKHYKLVGQTVPHAICLAALKVLEHIKNHAKLPRPSE